jgi:cysteine desulfurase
MTVNSSKLYGPKGAALLYKREGLKVSPITLGGGQERELRSGTEAVALYYAFAIALQETNELQENETKRLQELNDYFRSKLSQEIQTVIFYGAFDEVGMLMDGHTEPKRVMRRLPNNINCRIPGISSEEMILRLDAKGFAVSHKSACASLETDGSYVVMALGANEEEALQNIRISFGRTTSKQDLDRLVGAMKEISRKYVK